VGGELRLVPAAEDLGVEGAPGAGLGRAPEYARPICSATGANAVDPSRVSRPAWQNAGSSAAWLKVTPAWSPSSSATAPPKATFLASRPRPRASLTIRPRR